MITYALIIIHCTELKQPMRAKGEDASDNAFTTMGRYRVLTVILETKKSTLDNFHGLRHLGVQPKI